MSWQPIETAPKDGTVFLALNFDREVWVSKYETRYPRRLLFRTNKLVVSERYDVVRVKGEALLREKPSACTEHWRSDWTLWTRGYEFKPTHWMALPLPPEAP